MNLAGAKMVLRLEEQLDADASRAEAHGVARRRSWRPTSHARCAGWRSRPARSSRPATTARSTSCGTKHGRQEAGRRRSSSARRRSDHDMDLNKLTFKSQEALQAAQRLADDRNACSRSRPSTCSPRCCRRAGRRGVPDAAEARCVAAHAARSRRRSDRRAAEGVRRPSCRAARSGLRLARARPPFSTRAQKEADALEGRVRLDRAPAPRARAATREQSAALLRDAGRDEGRDPARARRRARRAHRDRPGSGVEVPGAREVRPRPHRARAARQARPGHRTGRRDPTRDPRPVAPDEEQPRAHRGAGHRARPRSPRVSRSASPPATSRSRSRTSG